MRKLLIAQHSRTMVDHLQRALQDEWEIHICMDSYPVIDMMQYMRPDAMILDLNLAPKNGISVLEESQPFVPPAVVATSNYVDDNIIETIENLGVGALVRIPFRLEHIKGLLRDLSKDLPEQKDVIWHLRTLGINPKLTGYRCLIAAISLFAINRRLLMKEAYIEVAKLCGINDVRRVERVIRTAVNNAWKKRNVDIWTQYFPANSQGDIEKPSNKELIICIADKL